MASSVGATAIARRATYWASSASATSTTTEKRAAARVCASRPGPGWKSPGPGSNSTPGEASEPAATMPACDFSAASPRIRRLRRIASARSSIRVCAPASDTRRAPWCADDTGLAPPSAAPAESARVAESAESARVALSAESALSARVASTSGARRTGRRVRRSTRWSSSSTLIHRCRWVIVPTLREPVGACIRAQAATDHRGSPSARAGRRRIHVSLPPPPREELTIIDPAGATRVSAAGTACAVVRPPSRRRCANARRST